MVEAAEFNTAREKIYQAVAEWARSFNAAQVDAAISAFPQVIQRLAASGVLSRMKHRVEALDQSAYRDAERILGDAEIWPDRDGLGAAQIWAAREFVSAGRPRMFMAPDELRNLLGLILGRVGEVLAEYDLAAIDRVPIYWTRTPEGVKYQDSEAPPDYVVRALEAFRDLWQRQARENRDRDDAQRSIDSEAARRLWDDA